jgi:acetylornithine deacetylase
MINREIADQVLPYIDPDEVIALAREMFRIPSLTGEEQELAEFLANRLSDVGLEVEMPEVEPGRPNVIGRLQGEGTGPSFMFNGHMDHNMVCEGWTHDPFGADLKDGWVVALGAANMKSADCGYLAAVKAIKDSGIPLKGDLIVEYVVGELEGGKGTRHAIAQGVYADYFIDGEPTRLNIKTRHAGVVVAKVHVYGRMRHFHNYEGKALHAVEKATKVIQALGPSYTPIPPDSWLRYMPQSGWEGLPQHNVGSIRGGLTSEYLDWRAALCPDLCTLKIDVRIVPGQTQEGVLADLNRLLAGIQADDPDFRAEAVLDSDHILMPAFNVPDDEPLVQMVKTAHEQLRGVAPIVGDIGPARFAGADSAHLAAAGMTGLLYGPGGEYLSVPDERVRAEDIVTAAQVYAMTAATICGGS